MPSHAIPSPLLRARPPAPSAAAAAATGRRAPSRVVAALGGGGPAGRGMEQQQQLAGDGSRSPGSSSSSVYSSPTSSSVVSWPWVGVSMGPESLEGNGVVDNALVCSRCLDAASVGDLHIFSDHDFLVRTNTCCNRIQQMGHLTVMCLGIWFLCLMLFLFGLLFLV